MGKQTRRPALLVAAAVAAALSIGACKKRGLPAAREQVEKWGGEWKNARSCLVGDRQSAADTAVALLLRDLADPQGSTAVASCVASFTSLEHAASDVEAVERAWLAVDNAAKRLVSLVPDYSSTEAKTRERLAKLIDEVDAAYAALRSAAEMEPVTASSEMASEIPPAPEGIRITGRDGAAIEVQRLEVAGNTLTAEGASEVIVFRGPDAVERVPIAADTIPALGGAGWGMRLDARGQLRSGALDDQGGLAGTGKVIAGRKVPQFKDTRKITPYFAIGKDKKRVVVYEREFVNGIAEVWIQVSHDRGRTWRRSVYIPYAGSKISPHSSWALGQVHLTWDYTGRLHWLPMGEATLGSLMKERTLRKSTKRTYGTESCFGPKRVWFVAEGSVIRVEQDASAPAQILSWEVPLGATYYCDDERLAAVVHKRDQVQIHECGAGGCRKPWKLARRGSSIMNAAFAGERGLIAGSVVEDHLLLFLRNQQGEVSARVVYRAEDAYLGALLVWGETLHAVLQQPGGTRIVPLPAD